MARESANPSASFDTLLDQLRTGDDIAARAAAETLGKLGPSATLAVPDLIDALEGRRRHGMPQVQLHAAVALGRIGDRRAVAPLTKVLASPAPAHRREAVRALGSIGGPDAVRPLGVMVWDEDRHVRAAAAKLLGVGAPDGKEVAAKRKGALAVVDAAWRGKPRTCPACGRTFVAQQSRCKCPDCLTEFFASHPDNPHEFPFDLAAGL
ncbi:MAG TPA: HEAT repeat domain-containing protein [Tepidisphaeraceae bacterium]|nr:HEAT repeat domain-containing protein [Tepidisphaeraceae bacterium]